ncbi:MAG: GntR family transcriptional regulator [Phycisphaerae bacterium]|nr:GntR family transcriptional regulator [Phycisphaerae bacterium]
MSVERQSEKAYQHLRRQLIGRFLPPGTRLKETHWARTLRINRGDVRQALARLFAEGLIVKGEGKGFFVRDYSPKDTEEMLETRYLLEKGAAELVIERATKEDLRELEEIHSHMITMAQNEYEQGFDEADLRFHTVFVRSAHNDRLMEVYDHANIMLTGAGAGGLTGPAARENLLAVAEEHKRIIQAIRKKDLPALRELLQRK